MDSDAVVIVPSRGRPENIRRLRDAWVEHTVKASLMVVVDADDPKLPEYEEIGPVLVNSAVQRLGPILNMVATRVAGSVGVIGFMGDDHLPRTYGWDVRLMASLARPGVAYGNDLVQGERLPTACMISASLIQTIGFMAPPRLLHLFLDDFWAELGRTVGNLAYHPDVIVEHLHPIAERGVAMDAGYEVTLDRGFLEDERGRWTRFLLDKWPAYQAMLRDSLEVARG